VAYGSPAPEQLEPSAARRDASATASKDRRYWAWADLMRRAFEIDVLACPRCGGRMQLIATIEDPSVIRKILAHLGFAHRGPAAAPAVRPQRTLAAVTAARIRSTPAPRVVPPGVPPLCTRGGIRPTPRPTISLDHPLVRGVASHGEE